MTERTRADRLLLARGIFASRARAQAAIAAGRVLADGVKVRKASQALAADARIEAEPVHGFVSRGGVKLQAAVQRAVCGDIIAFLAALGWTGLGVIESPIRGGDGNREFLLGAYRG